MSDQKDGYSLWKAGLLIGTNPNSAHVHVIAKDLIDAARKAERWAEEKYSTDNASYLLIVELVDTIIIE